MDIIEGKKKIARTERALRVQNTELNATQLLCLNYVFKIARETVTVRNKKKIKIKPCDSPMSKHRYETQSYIHNG